MDHQNLRHLHGLRDFIRNLVEQAERSGGCECHRPPSLLLVGPPGVGKTYLVKQMSNVCDMPLFGVHTHQLAGPLSLRNLFVNARELDYPSLFFLDDIDFIFSNHDVKPGHNDFSEALRQELYKQLGPRKLKIFDPNSDHNPVQERLPNTPSPETKRPHQEDDPDNNGLILVAATSSPWLLYKDHELLSRFRGVYLVGLPDRETRYHLLKYLLQKVQHNLTEKDFWVVADKTEGYTPSDLLMVAKALNYEQFAFLFSMAGINSYEDSDEESVTTSDMTETDTDSNFDQVDRIESRGKRVVDAKDEKKTSSDDSRSLPKNSFGPSEESSSKTGNNTTIGLIKKDWSLNESDASSRKEINLESSPLKSSTGNNTTIGLIMKDWTLNESDASSRKETSLEDGKSPKKEINDEDAPNADGATTDSTLTEDNNERLSEAVNPYLNSDKPSVNNDCDSSSNVLDSDTDQDAGIHPVVGKVSSVSETPCEKLENGLSPSNSDDETKEFELRIVEPADPFKNDNQAVDSGSDSDNENSGDFVKRSRRVNFSNVPSMHPLTVDVDHSDDISPNISLGYEPAVSISPVLDDNLLNKDTYCGSSSNNILKRLLSSSPTLHEEMDDDNLNNKNTRNKEKSLSKDDGYLNTNYMNDYSDVVRNAIGGDETDSCRLKKKENKSDDLQIFSRSPVVRRNSLNEDRRSLTGIASILTGVSSQLTGVSSRLTGVSPQLTGVSPQLTPIGSDSSSTSTADNSSESGSGRRIRMNTPTPDNEARKTRDTRDSDSSLYGKSDTPTIPSSEVSSATCNVSGETLECHSDSDERLRNLEDDLKGRRPVRTSDSDDDDDDEGLSGEEDNDTLRTILNLNSLGEVSIKILTINDVLNVVNRTARSVSDEEIKKYTDFMVWFANVAKSACPHNSKGTMSDTASSADVSVVSSTWSQFPSTKKRKGPLRKLGRFLLKALMFILD